MAVDIIARGIAGAAQVGLAQANERIDRLEGKTTRLLYTASTDPTAADINSFVEGLGYTSPFEGIGVVIAGTYHIWHYYENDSIGWRDDGVDTITPFTNSLPGSILGSVDDGKVTANNDGTGSVNGWNDKLNSIAAALAYDNTKAYTIDEICTYNGHLYICIQNTTAGTLPTDTTYWEEISVIQLINEFKLALRDGSFIVEKANNSNSSLSTKAIDPISEESGTIHEVPFISQGTGTANNTASVDTSPVAKQLEKQGYTVANVQLAKELNSTNWSTYGGGATYSSGVAIFTATETNGNFRQLNIPLISGHKYLVFASLKLTTGSTLIRLNMFSDNVSGYDPTSVYTENNTNWQTLRFIKTASATESYQLRVIDGRTSGWDAIQVKEVRLVDLTQYFNGNANIPQDLLDNPSHWSWYDNGTGAYDAGTLKNGNGRYLVCTGRNLIGDTGDYETGTINNSTGQNEPDSTNVRLKGYKIVVPNRQYYISNFGNKVTRLYWYDKDKNFIASYTNIETKIITAPANAVYYRDRSTDTYGATYKNDHDVSLYYSPEQGGEGYDQRYDYVEPNVYDTGTEELLKAGSAVDNKDSNGTVTRRVGTKKLNELPWTLYATNTFRSTTLISGAVYNDGTNIPSIRTAKYLATNYANTPDYSDRWVKMFISGGTRQIIIKDARYETADAFSNSLTDSDLLYYELATPTTEQGTSFPENISVNDYGMMYWLDTDGNLVSIPQGCKLFYPVDYVLYLDTLVSHTEGDATSLVRWSDMATQSEIDEILDLI